MALNAFWKRAFQIEPISRIPALVCKPLHHLVSLMSPLHHLATLMSPPYPCLTVYLWLLAGEVSTDYYTVYTTLTVGKQTPMPEPSPISIVSSIESGRNPRFSNHKHHKGAY